MQLIIVIAFLLTFGVFLVLSIGLGLIVVIAAFLVGKFVPRAHDRCAKWIAGWKSKRGLLNRLLVGPLLITIAIFVTFAVIGFADTYRLRRGIEESTHVVIRSGGSCHRRPEQEAVLLRLTKPDEIKALSQNISIGLSIPGMACRCCGDMTFDFYRNDEICYSFTLHHGERIRIKGNSMGDKELSSASRRNLNNWLNQKGVNKALEEALKQGRLKRDAELKAMVEDTQPEN